MLRYLLSNLIPVPMRSTYVGNASGAAIEAGASGTNHFRDDDHDDLVSIRWWQWRGRCFGQRTVSTCLV